MEQKLINISKQLHKNNQIQYQESNLETEKVDETFFTVNLPRDVGLSDQLWHLSKLYSLGIALSYTYVHTPFRCPRSYSVGYLETIIIQLKKLLKTPVDIRKSSADKLIKFIGLDKHDLNISDTQFRKYKIIEINLDKILGESEIPSASDFKKNIEFSDLSLKSVIYCFVSQGIYKFEAKIDQIISSVKLDDSTIKYLDLPEKYWRAKKLFPVNIPLENSRVNVVIHIRKGDRTQIKLNKKIVSIFGSSVNLVNSNGAREKPNTELLNTKNSYNIIQKIFSKYGENIFSVVVISDGYQRAFHAIVSAVIRGKIKLKIEELKQLYKIKKTLNREFDIFSSLPNVSLVVGESKKNLFKCIHAIICADILIVTSGGFAYWLHMFFRRSNQLSMIINLNSYDNQTIDKVRNIVLKKIGRVK
jgi:hypothetical protein